MLLEPCVLKLENRTMLTRDHADGVKPIEGRALDCRCIFHVSEVMPELRFYGFDLPTDFLVRCTEHSIFFSHGSLHLQAWG